jgi:hypothetical protein
MVLAPPSEMFSKTIPLQLNGTPKPTGITAAIPNTDMVKA